jgi:hypothetical protein
VWIWDSQRRARRFAKARGLANEFDVFGTAAAGPFLPSGSAGPLPSIGTSKDGQIVHLAATTLTSSDQTGSITWIPHKRK